MGLSRKRSVAAAAAFALVATACSGSTPDATSLSKGIPATTEHSSTTPQPVTGTHSVVLLSGTVRVESAQTFDDPGFHKAVSVTGSLPESALLAGAAAGILTVSLWDASRPDQTCNQDHPLSGCLTIDWSDAPGRPRVPDSGVFDNQLALISADGPRAYYLSESGALSAVPNQFTPG